MPTPQFVSEKPLSLVEVQRELENIQKRDIELNYVSAKVHEYLSSFVAVTPEQREVLHKKLKSLDLIRLKEEHIAKIIDFLPKNVNELRAILQAYPLSLVKKDQESIIEAVKDVMKE